MKATFRSKPFEAFQLASDMSNWKEALEFMGAEMLQDYEQPPEFLDVNTWEEITQAYPTNWIAKSPQGLFFVYTDEEVKRGMDRA